jgi:quercetin dioxygenase-like cupin family protein
MATDQPPNVFLPSATAHVLRPGVSRRLFVGGAAASILSAMLGPLTDVSESAEPTPTRTLRQSVTSVEEVATDEFEWGALKWLYSGTLSPGVEQTVGLCHILPGKTNPMHFHPNCDEVLYMISGRGEHSFNAEKVTLTPGMAIHIPRGVRHNLANTGWESITCLVAFSSADRQMVLIK